MEFADEILATNAFISSLTLVISLGILAYISRFVISTVEDLIEVTGLGEATIGFAILSVITSTPELIVAFFSVSEGAPALTIGDILGSNVFNIGVVVGILLLTSGFLKQCPMNLGEVADILLFSSIIPLLLVIFEVNNPIVGIGLIVIFIFSVYREIKNKIGRKQIDSQDKKDKKKIFIFIKILIGTIFVVVSARFAVLSALDIASAFGIPPLFLGAKLLALGTSLPELSLSLTAVKRGHIYLASANAIGSNLTNLTLILGMVFFSSVFAPFSISIIAFIKIISFVLFTSIILWYYLTKGGNCTVIGIILILTYIVFQIIVS